MVIILLFINLLFLCIYYCIKIYNIFPLSRTPTAYDFIHGFILLELVLIFSHVYMHHEAKSQGKASMDLSVENARRKNQALLDLDFRILTSNF